MARNIVSTSVSPRFFSNRPPTIVPMRHAVAAWRMNRAFRASRGQSAQSAAEIDQSHQKRRRQKQRQPAGRTPRRNGCRYCAGADSRRTGNGRGISAGTYPFKNCGFADLLGTYADERVSLDHLPAGAPDDGAECVGIGLPVRPEERQRAFLYSGGRGDAEPNATTTGIAAAAHLFHSQSR